MHAIRQEQQIRLGPYEQQERWQCKTNSLIWFCHRKKQRINTVIVNCVHDFSDICGASKYSKNLPPPTGWAICLSWPRNRERKLIILQFQLQNGQNVLWLTSFLHLHHNCTIKGSFFLKVITIPFFGEISFYNRDKRRSGLCEENIEGFAFCFIEHMVFVSI